MSMKLGYDLTIEQTQKLVMTPELIQAIKILQFNIQELESYVQDQILTNPVLEQEAEPQTDQPLHEEDGTQEPASSRNESQDWEEYIRGSYEEGRDGQWDRQWIERQDDSADFYERYVDSDLTLPEHLMFQLQLTARCETEERIGRYIIESLDENGYLTVTVEEIAETLQAEHSQVEDALRLIQGMDPAGVGARDLRECLLIQLEALGLATDAFRTLVTEHLEDLADNRLSVIARKVGASTEEVQQMVDVIRTLEPKPGRQFAGGEETKYIIPDVIIEKTESGFSITVNNNNTPQLKVSSYYRKLLHQAKDDDQLSNYLSERVNSALWLIRSIDQRKQTIYNVTEAIVRHQQDFFERGSKYMKTLTLRDIAEDVGIHESTVSRSINGKYLQCSYGIFELRHFFSAGVKAESGEGVSSSSVKEFIREIVGSEDPKKPFSDQAIVGKLSAKGFEISRRTVAKYRDEMNIPSSSRRKRY
ncbi:MAG: RNA polymerase factor sigma-54 [Firmicutes bacterium]|nr:RNA polymerase factor sigma-54 [Bacillota bacterium]